jgi:protein-tyrosine phosphatase
VGAVLRTAVRRGSRVVDLFRERRRAEAVRRDPAAVTALLQRATRVLVVCHGNIIRSAFAASLIGRALGSESGLAISSAGLEATPGREADPTAVDVARRFGIDLTTHAATRLTPALVAAADAIFVMEVPQLADLCARFPEARPKAFLFSCLSPEAPLEIADPYDCDQAVFERRFDEIAGAAYSLIRALSDRAS